MEAQNGQWGLPALVLLVCAFALFWLSRTRHWLGRTAMLAPAALGLVAALAIVIGLAVRGTLSSTMVGVLLLITWVFSAGYAALHGFLDNLGPLPPKTWHSGLPLLVLYAIIGAAPTAVGRWLFAPELRDAAARLQDNTVAMSRAALWTSSYGLALPQRSARRRGCLGCLPGVAAAPRACLHRSQPHRARHPDHHCRHWLAGDNAGQQES